MLCIDILWFAIDWLFKGLLLGSTEAIVAQSQLNLLTMGFECNNFFDRLSCWEALVQDLLAKLSGVVFESCDKLWDLGGLLEKLIKRKEGVRGDKFRKLSENLSA